MKFKPLRIAALSRDPSFLVRSVLWVLIPGVILAFAISQWRSEAIEKEKKNPPDSFRDSGITISSRADCVRLLDMTRANEAGALRLADEADAAKLNFTGLLGAERFLSEEEVTLFIDYRVHTVLTRATLDKEERKPFAQAAAKEPVSGFVCSMYGDLLKSAREFDTALEVYLRGAGDPETGVDCRRRALSLCAGREWHGKLKSLYHQPGWREAVLEKNAGDWSRNYAVARIAGDWTGIVSLIWDSVWMRLKSPEWIIMASLTGLLWFLVIHVAAGVPVKRWWLGLLGFGCGLLSIPLTHFFNTLQEVWFDAERNGDVLNDILYCISSIGLREELAKLLLFVPLLPLLRRASSPEVLAVAASVGLGFAALENVGYFEWGPGANVWGRFITANFIHFALTGLSGLALWQAVRNSAWLTRFAGVFTGAVLFHGLWDFSPTDPRLAGDYHYILYICLVVLALYFFKDLARYTQVKQGVPSAQFIYLTGGALLLSAVLCVFAWHMGFRLALVGAFEPVLGLFAIGAAMFYELRKV